MAGKDQPAAKPKKAPRASIDYKYILASLIMGESVWSNRVKENPSPQRGLCYIMSPQTCHATMKLP